MEVLELQPETVNMDVVKLNVTDSEIASMKDQYMHLTINGIEDKEGLKKVYESRQIVKKTRTSLVKYADQLKEKAIAWQRKVNTEKNRIVTELEGIEAHLQAEEDKIAAEKERIRQEEERKEQERIQTRVDRLSKFGFSIDIAFLKAVSDEDFEKVVANAKGEHEKELAAKAEQERLAKAEAERLKAEREELELLRKQQAEAQKIIDEQNRKIREEEERQAKERDEVRKQKMRNRIDQLIGLGLTYTPVHNAYVFMDVNVDVLTELQFFDDKEWGGLIEEITPVIAQRKQEVEGRRLAEIKRLQEEAAAKALREREEEEEKQRQAEAERLAQASDKEKFQAVLQQLRTITIPEMKSRKAKTLSTVVRGGIDKLIENITTTI